MLPLHHEDLRRPPSRGSCKEAWLAELADLRIQADLPVVPGYPFFSYNTAAFSYEMGPDALSTASDQQLCGWASLSKPESWP